ncbi:MAG: porin [Hyphomicrobiaceae bacterium]
MSGNLKRASIGLVSMCALAAGIGFASNAQAADLGGNCCADLEERIAELEATTVRKGNRKVSLAISGWVAEQVMWWDDGSESNVYVGGIGTTLASHFKLTGQATIAPGYQAGYVIQVETDTADPLLYNQNNDDTNAGISVLQSYWFINSDRLGKLSVGQLSPASDNTAILVDGSGSLVPANWVLFDNQGFFLKSRGSVSPGSVPLNWGDIAHCRTSGSLQEGSLGVAGDCGSGGVPGNYVRYDSPTFAGFSVSADWGEDDAWDVAARYAGEFNGFKIAVATSYYRTNEYRDLAGYFIDKVSYFQIGAFVHHVPTGLFVYGAYGHEKADFALDLPSIFPDNNDSWYVKAGLRRKLNDLGHTVLFGEYGEKNDAVDQGAFLVGAYSIATGSKLRQWGLGVVQEIDAAAMSMWLMYRNYDGDLDLVDFGGRFSVDLDTMHVVKAGALINF